MESQTNTLLEYLGLKESDLDETIYDPNFDSNAVLRKMIVYIKLNSRPKIKAF